MRYSLKLEVVEVWEIHKQNSIHNKQIAQSQTIVSGSDQSNGNETNSIISFVRWSTFVAKQGTASMISTYTECHYKFDKVQFAFQLKSKLHSCLTMIKLNLDSEQDRFHMIDDWIETIVKPISSKLTIKIENGYNYYRSKEQKKTA